MLHPIDFSWPYFVVFPEYMNNLVPEFYFEDLFLRTISGTTTVSDSENRWHTQNNSRRT